MSSENVQKLVKFLFQDASHLDQWLQNPHGKTKEWSYELSDQEIESVTATLSYIYGQFQQIQEIRNVNQRSILKLNEASYHNRWSFYASLGMHLLIFSIGIIMLSLGMYAAFTDKMALGFVLGVAGGAEIVYFLFSKPLQGLNESIGNLVQMEVALGGWFNEMAYWQVFLKNTLLEEKQSVAQAMRDATKWTIMLIEDYCSNGQKGEKKSAEAKENEDFFSRTRSLIENLVEKRKREENFPAEPASSPEKKSGEISVTPQETAKPKTETPAP